MDSLKIVIERHPDGFVSYPLGFKGVVVGQGDTYDEALADIRSAIRFHIETFGPEPVNSSDVAKALNLSLSQAAPIRDELIKKGMAYSPERGLIGFTVPKFDDYLRRIAPRARAGRKPAKT